MGGGRQLVARLLQPHRDGPAHGALWAVRVAFSPLPAPSAQPREITINRGLKRAYAVRVLARKTLADRRIFEALSMELPESR